MKEEFVHRAEGRYSFHRAKAGWVKGSASGNPVDGPNLVRR